MKIYNTKQDPTRSTFFGKIIDNYFDSEHFCDNCSHFIKLHRRKHQFLHVLHDFLMDFKYVMIPDK